jgi:general nucleoside transport system permease protein
LTQNTNPPPRRRWLPGRHAVWMRDDRVQAVLVPVLAVITALILGAGVILVSGGNPLLAYAGLYEGSIGCPGALSDGSLDVTRLVCADSIADTLVTATPFIVAGLAVAIAFKCGLFNIGVEGQLLAGSLATVFVGYSISGIPAVVHIPLALLAGVAAGAVWGGIPGVLKAFTGAHEVIVTIMLNYIAATMTSYLLSGVMKDPGSGAVARTRYIAESARLPDLAPAGDILLHLGIPIAVGIAVAIWWLLYRTTLGYEIRTVGANPFAARYAGISVAGSIVLTMAMAGGLGGLAGAIEVTGVNYYHTPGFSVGYGFDSIAIALLGRSSPIGVIPAALLFGGLRAGASRMQFLTQIPVDIIQVIQALVLIFVAAPAIVRWLYRLRSRRGGLASSDEQLGIPAAAGEGVI